MLFTRKHIYILYIYIILYIYNLLYYIIYKYIDRCQGLARTPLVCLAFEGRLGLGFEGSAFWPPGVRSGCYGFHEFHASNLNG